jgi:hypothetical protein
MNLQIGTTGGSRLNWRQALKMLTDDETDGGTGWPAAGSDGKFECDSGRRACDQTGPSTGMAGRRRDILGQK